MLHTHLMGLEPMTSSLTLLLTRRGDAICARTHIMALTQSSKQHNWSYLIFLSVFPNRILGIQEEFWQLFFSW